MQTHYLPTKVQYLTHVELTNTLSKMLWAETIKRTRNLKQNHRVQYVAPPPSTKREKMKTSEPASVIVVSGGSGHVNWEQRHGDGLSVRRCLFVTMATSIIKLYFECLFCAVLFNQLFLYIHFITLKTVYKIFM